MYLPYQSFTQVVQKWIEPFFNRLNEEHFTFHRQYKYSGTFANRKYEQLSHPKNPKMCEPILVAELNARASRARRLSPIAKVIYPSQKIW